MMTKEEEDELMELIRERRRGTNRRAAAFYGISTSVKQFGMKKSDDIASAPRSTAGYSSRIIFLFC